MAESFDSTGFEDENPLSLVGGFQGYQDWLYNKVRRRLADNLGKIKAIERRLEAEGELSEGLEEGLIVLLRGQRYLTTKNLTALERHLDFYKDAMPIKIPRGQTEYWGEKVQEWKEDYPGYDKLDVIYLVLGKESDKIIGTRSEVRS